MKPVKSGTACLDPSGRGWTHLGPTWVSKHGPHMRLLASNNEPGTYGLREHANIMFGHLNKRVSSRSKSSVTNPPTVMLGKMDTGLYTQIMSDITKSLKKVALSVSDAPCGRFDSARNKKNMQQRVWLWISLFHLLCCIKKCQKQRL